MAPGALAAKRPVSARADASQPSMRQASIPFKARKSGLRVAPAAAFASPAACAVALLPLHSSTGAAGATVAARAAYSSANRTPAALCAGLNLQDSEPACSSASPASPYRLHAATAFLSACRQPEMLCALSKIASTDTLPLKGTRGGIASGWHGGYANACQLAFLCPETFPRFFNTMHPKNDADCLQNLLVEL